MIRIKDYIFNENDIRKIYYNKDCDTLCVGFRDKDLLTNWVENATFEDIEWNYENNNEYCNVFYEDRIKELEEENKKLNELVQFNVKTTATLTKRINKAIEYIENKEINYATFNSKDLLDTGVGSDLWKILKGEENEN